MLRHAEKNTCTVLIASQQRCGKERKAVDNYVKAGGNTPKAVQFIVISHAFCQLSDDNTFLIIEVM